MARRKIALIGAGNIGSVLALMIGQKRLGDVALVDVAPGLARGKALDIGQALAFTGGGSEIQGGEDMALIDGADAIVVTAGKARTPGMGRADLIDANAVIVSTIGREIAKRAPDAFVICVTNPLDAMTWVLHESSGLPRHRLAGMAGGLDSARLRYYLAQEFNVALADVTAFVIGGHNDMMAPLPRYSTVRGIPLPDLVAAGWTTQEKIDRIIERTRGGGVEIIELLKTGSASFAPAAATLAMLESVLEDQKRVLPATVWVDGFYGLDGMHIGAPVVLGEKGVERIIEIALNEEEKQAFARSVATTKDLIEKTRALLAGRQ